MISFCMRMYQYELMDHYQSPRNYGLCTSADFISYEHNPSCGDLVTVSGQFDKDLKLIKVGFEASGCVISVATASLLLQFCSGRSYDELVTLDKNVVMQLIGIELGPTRLRCAFLPYQAFYQGLMDYKKR